MTDITGVQRELDKLKLALAADAMNAAEARRRLDEAEKELLAAERHTASDLTTITILKQQIRELKGSVWDGVERRKNR